MILIIQKNIIKLIKINKKLNMKNLKRKDHKYDLLIPIKYNTKKSYFGLGSCIFIHLTKNYKPTAGCIALKKKIF
jgi:L,D-peptidoglycan transpeptidase YkuD (ErfK/YbiS/YcfS/YnhG family)